MNYIVPFALYHDEADHALIYCTKDDVTVSTARTDRELVEATVELLIWKTRALEAERHLDAIAQARRHTPRDPASN